MSHTIFVPATAELLQNLLSHGAISVSQGFAATQALRRTFSLDDRADEEAEFTAQAIASTACLVEGRDRVVIAFDSAELPAGADPVDLGGVDPGELAGRRLRSLFCDDPEDLPAMRELAGRLRGIGLEEAWRQPEVSEQAQETSMMWFDASEAEQLLAMLRERETETLGSPESEQE